MKKKIVAALYLLSFLAVVALVVGPGMRERLRKAQEIRAAEAAGGRAEAAASPAGPPAPGRKPWERKTVWQPPREVVAGTPESFRRVMRAHGMDKGDYLVAFVDLGCDACVEALEFFKSEPDANKVAFTVAGREEAEKFSAARSLGFPLISVSGEEFEDLGAVFMPTVLRATDGRVTSATDNYRSVYPPEEPAAGEQKRGGRK